MTKANRLAGLTLLLLVGALALAHGLHANAHKSETCDDPSALLEVDRIPIPAGRTKVVRPRARVDGILKPPSRRESPMAFTVRRTYRVPEWLLRPTQGVPGPAEPDEIRRFEIDVDGEAVPVVFAYEMTRANQRFAAYIFEYDRQPVRHPFTSRFLDTPRALFNGARPVTYLGVAASGHPSQIPALETRALEWLEEAWRHYRKTCTP